MELNYWSLWNLLNVEIKYIFHRFFYGKVIMILMELELGWENYLIGKWIYLN